MIIGGKLVENKKEQKSDEKKGKSKANRIGFHKRLENAWRGFRYRGEVRLMSLGIVVGLIVGLGVVIFTSMIDYLTDTIYSNKNSELKWNLIYLAAPPLGGLAAGIVTKLALETRGDGIPESLEALYFHGGRIRTRVPFVKAIATSITIGTGGSAGREGPCSQIGAGLGSIISRFLNLRFEERRMLAAAGICSGISATFNAPLGGALFGFEVLVGVMQPFALVLIVLASITASTVMVHFRGANPAIELPFFRFDDSLQMFLFALLGLCAGFIAFSWVRLFDFIEDLFEKIDLPPEIKPALGGLVVGVIAFGGVTEITGQGYDVMKNMIKGELTLITLVGFLIFKMIATGSTCGSGGSGGAFAPSLFLGVAWGAIFGEIMVSIGLISEADKEMVAIVAMGAVFSGAARAPIASTVLLFEMTGQFSLLPPLLAANILSYALAIFLIGEADIYHIRLYKRGLRMKRGHLLDILDETRVQDVMTVPVETLPDSMPVGEAVEIFMKGKHTGYPIVNKDGELVGIVTFSDIRNTLQNPDIDLKTTTLGELFTSGVITIKPHETMHHVMDRMFKYGIGRLPVVLPTNPKKPIGIVTKTDLMKAHELMLLDRETWEKIFFKKPPEKEKKKIDKQNTA